MASFWQFGDDLRGQAKVSDDHEWFMVASKLAEQARMKDERMNNLDLSKGLSEVRAEKFGIQEENKYESHKFKVFGLDSKFVDSSSKMSFGNSFCNASSFGGSNIDPTAWEDKKCKGESRFPAQVRIQVRKLCKALEEDSFRPVLHHYDGPKFRLELSVPETLELLDLCEQAGTPA
ncbi:hypothetical protein SAY87_023001 [Trapa incisa]|uniref:DCD domain-containing protein n=1 Tax=Trapa incisa TaxID=236973 RepID=A0AAN7K3K6_9MYRT|nr:hypothetical protein SAY87_023001 [Trapa incisa]